MPTASAAAVGVINAAIVALTKAFADRGLTLADGRYDAVAVAPAYRQRVLVPPVQR